MTAQSGYALTILVRWDLNRTDHLNKHNSEPDINLNQKLNT